MDDGRGWRPGAGTHRTWKAFIARPTVVPFRRGRRFFPPLESWMDGKILPGTEVFSSKSAGAVTGHAQQRRTDAEIQLIAIAGGQPSRNVYHGTPVASQTCVSTKERVTPWACVLAPPGRWFLRGICGPWEGNRFDAGCSRGDALLNGASGKRACESRLRAWARRFTNKKPG